MTNVIFDFLPSFYRNQLVDSDGQSLLEPLFEQYTNYAGDLLSQVQQLSLLRCLELCPVVVKEAYKTIDITAANLNTSATTQQFNIDPTIVAFDTLYYDYGFTLPVALSHNIIVNEVTKKSYIEFPTPISHTYKTLYTPNGYRNPNLLRDLYGSLLQYDSITYNYSSLNNFISGVEVYRKKLIALMYGLRHASSLTHMTTALAIFLGRQYSPVDGVINIMTSNQMGILDVNGVTHYVNSNNLIDIYKYYIGQPVSKYDVVEKVPFVMYDIFSNPARFTQMLLCNSGAILLQLLDIDTANDESYATLFFDSELLYDATNLYWDMGNNAGVNHTPTDATIYPETWMDIFVTNFSEYIDARWSSQKLYEMFRNLFIVEFDLEVMSAITDLRLSSAIILDRIKPSRSKYIIPVSTTPVEPFFGLVSVWDMTAIPPVKVFDAWDDLGEAYIVFAQLPFSPHSLDYKYDFTTNMMDGSPETLTANYSGLVGQPMNFSTSLFADWGSWIPYGRMYVNVCGTFQS